MKNVICNEQFYSYILPVFCLLSICFISWPLNNSLEKGRRGIFLCCLSILESAGQSWMTLKGSRNKGTDPRLLLWRKFMPLPLLKGFFSFFLLPNVLAAQITHLEEQCSKKLWRVKTIDFKENYMQSENGSNSSNSTSHSAEWIKGRRVHYIHHWHLEGLFFPKVPVKALMASFFPQVHENVSFF